MQRPGDDGEAAQRGVGQALVAAEHRTIVMSRPGSRAAAVATAPGTSTRAWKACPSSSGTTTARRCPSAATASRTSGSRGADRSRKLSRTSSPGALPAHLVDQRGHRGGRARVAAPVRDGDQCGGPAHGAYGATASGVPTSPAASVLPVGGSMSRKLPVARMSA